jgi:hypothetical protein
VERIDFVKKPLEDEYVSGVSLNDEEQGCHNHDDIGSLALIRRCNWDTDYNVVLGGPCYDTNNEYFMARGTNIYHPFHISLENNFMMQQEEDSNFIFLGFAPPKSVEVCGAFVSIFDHQHPYTFSRKADLLHHRIDSHHEVVLHEKEVQPMIFLAGTYTLHMKSAKECIFMAVTCMD